MLIHQWGKVLSDHAAKQLFSNPFLLDMYCASNVVFPEHNSQQFPGQMGRPTPTVFTFVEWLAAGMPSDLALGCSAVEWRAGLPSGQSHRRTPLMSLASMTSSMLYTPGCGSCSISRCSKARISQTRPERRQS